METTNTARRDTYLIDMLGVYGPQAARSIADDMADEHADCFIGLSGPDRRERARAVVAGFIVDREQFYLAECEPDYWHGVTTDEAHEIRAGVIRDVAAALVDIANAARDDAYDARMSCRRRSNDCGCRTCGG